jgi:hypothetical protein
VVQDGSISRDSKLELLGVLLLLSQLVDVKMRAYRGDSDVSGDTGDRWGREA